MYERVKNNDKQTMMFITEYNWQARLRGDAAKTYNVNFINRKECGMSCLHRGCIAPSLIILVDLLSDPTIDALKIDDSLETAQSKVPRNFLTSCKVVIRYERHQFVMTRLKVSYAKPGLGVEDHEVQEIDDGDFDVDRTIPHEAGIHNKSNSINSIKYDGKNTSFIDSQKGNLINSMIKFNQKYDFKKLIKSKQDSNEIDDSNGRQSIPIFVPTQSICREVGSTFTSIKASQGKLTVSKLKDDHDISDQLNMDASYCLFDGIALKEKIKLDLLGKTNKKPVQEAIEPLSEKIKSYTRFNIAIIMNNQNQMFNPFKVSAQPPSIHETVTKQLFNYNLPLKKLSNSSQSHFLVESPYDHHGNRIIAVF